FPMGIYSKKIKSLKDLKVGARIGVPNDPTNSSRALLLLQAQGLLKLKVGVSLQATPLDIVENPKKLKIIEIDAAQLPRSLDDLDAAAINGNYAEKAGLSPTKDGIAIEVARGPYSNIIAVRTEDKDKPWVAKLLKAYHSPDVKQFVVDQYKNSVITAW
ncbi:MAG: metal ABC transporter substrate-binding protein, partial [Glaciimonas sp.]|nr:metal ABC transporter substrate-binding protein [Glaciimonas sp.]